MLGEVRWGGGRHNSAKRSRNRPGSCLRRNDGGGAGMTEWRAAWAIGAAVRSLVAVRGFAPPT